MGVSSTPQRSAVRTLSASDWPAERIAAERERTLAVCVPARDEAATIGSVVDVLVGLREAGVIDEVIVVDDSADGTAAIARDAGADVHDQSSLLPHLGRVQGKGDALWRSLTVTQADVVCFLDGDTRDFTEAFPCGLLGPLCRPGPLRMAKGAFRRPWDAGGGAAVLPHGGGRVTELCARPLLNRFFPQLAGMSQPLAGEVAAERSLLESLPFATGYATDVALLLDAWALVGAEGLAEVDLGARQNRHRPLDELGPMAAAVTEAILRRAGLGEGPDVVVTMLDGAPRLTPVAVRERAPLGLAPRRTAA